MAIRIYDEGASIRIVNNGAAAFITKSHIKKVEALKADTVLVDIGKTGQDNVFIYFPEVKTPVVRNTRELAQNIAQMLPAAGGGGSAMTDLHLIEIFKELNRLREVNTRLLNLVTVGWWRDSMESVKIDDTQPGFIYKGYCDGARLEAADNVWSIQRIKNDHGIITNEWPDGTNAGAYRWDDRYSLDYKPRYL